MKLPQIILIVILSFVVAFVTARYFVPSNNSEVIAPEESAYSRVIRTGTLRCGYAAFAPYFTKDANTGAYGGIWYEFSEAVAAHLGLKIQWEEVGSSDIGTALDTKKIDAYCAALASAGKRGRVIDFLNPSAFEPVLVYVRPDDHRFDDNINLINDPDVKVSTKDGEFGGIAAAEDFPKATFVSLPQLAEYADVFNQVVTKKADVLLAAPVGAAAFLKNNPGALRPILSKPIRIFPEALGGVKYGENELRDMLNQAQDDVIYNGILDKIFDKYEVKKSEIWRVAKPYEQP